MTDENNLPELGPLLDEDAMLLEAIVRMTDPKILVEFGYFWGKSARVLLNAMDANSHLWSYDNTREPYQINIKDPRFAFVQKSQDEFQPIAGVDFVFIDASHELQTNIRTFKQLIDYLSPTAIIAVHDTGLWPNNVNKEWKNIIKGKQLSSGYSHCPDERNFVNWLKIEHPEFEQIHFHTTTKTRHGITLLQKYNHLEI